MTPLDKSLPQDIRDALAGFGVGSMEQLAEMEENALLQALDRTALLNLKRCAPCFPKPHPAPVLRPGGIPMAPSQDPAICQSRAGSRERHARLVRYLRDNPASSTAVSLIYRMGPVGDQGPHGVCAGFASAGARSFAIGTPMSGWAAHAGAKTRDGQPQEEGVFQYWAFQHFADVGPLHQRDYGKQDWLVRRDLAPLAHLAQPFIIDGCVDLLSDDHGFDYVVDLFRRILDQGMGTHRGGFPIAVSIAVYEGNCTPNAERTGMYRLNLPGERPISGHAMVLVGYRDADDPNNPFDFGVFIARNSYSADWAPDNPFGYPGHALIPYPFFTSKERLWEAYWCLG